MPPFNGRQLQQQIRVFLSFYSVTYNNVFAISMSNTATITTSSTSITTTQRPRRRNNMWVRPWLLQREERGPTTTLWLNCMPQTFQDSPRLARQATNYRAPISVGGNLALTIRYLATVESYTSLSCQFRVGRSTISKFLPEVCRAIQDEFTREYLRSPTTPDEWKELEMELWIGWNIPHALGALDGKHVALKKPKTSGALYHNYKGFFSIVMLALVDRQYKFRWVDVGTARSYSDAQIFNTCHLNRKIDDGSIGFPKPAPTTQGGRDVPCFILADEAFALKTWLMKPYGRRMLTREERIANYRISRGRRVVENAFGILVSRFRVMMTIIELPPETVRAVVLTCVVLHNILRSQYQGQHGGQQPGDGRLIGGAAACGCDRNPAREAKRLRDYLKDYFNNEGAVT